MIWLFELNISADNLSVYLIIGLLNRISAMVVDIRQAAGTAVSLEDFFGA